MVSHIGKNSVTQYIKQIGQKGFKIYMEGSKNPIYTSNAKNSDSAVKEFVAFSDNILSGNAEDTNIYHITIIKDGVGKVPQTLSETYFKFNDDIIEAESVGGAAYNTGNLGEMFGLLGKMMDVVAPFAKQRAENEVLKAQLEEIEEEEPEPEKESLTEKLITILAPALLNQSTPQPTNPVALSGTETQTPEVDVELLNSAIEKLLKADPDLPSDLMKLAELSETKPGFFKQLLSTLRNM